MVSVSHFHTFTGATRLFRLINKEPKNIKRKRQNLTGHEYEEVGKGKAGKWQNDV